MSEDDEDPFDEDFLREDSVEGSAKNSEPLDDWEDEVMIPKAATVADRSVAPVAAKQDTYSRAPPGQPVAGGALKTYDPPVVSHDEAPRRTTSNLFPPRHCMCCKSENHIKAHATRPHSLHPYVTINARGRVFSTSLVTLHRHQNSLLHQMFTPPIQLPYVRGQFALDVDPTAFSLVLDTLRDGYTTLPASPGTLADFLHLSCTLGIPLPNVLDSSKNYVVKEETYTVECFDYKAVTYFGERGYQVKTQTETSTLMSRVTRFQCVNALVRIGEKENTVEGLDACPWLMKLT